MITKLILGAVLISVSLNTLSAQVGIDKSSGFGGSAILEFGTESRGIRLTPITDATTLTAVAGTIVFDADTGSFRYYNGTSWSTAISGGCTSCGAPVVADASSQGAIIGSDTSVAQGVLILGKDTGETKGLILPNISITEAKIPNPAIGLMVYDTFSETIKIYNGNTWTSF